MTADHPGAPRRAPRDDPAFRIGVSGHRPGDKYTAGAHARAELERLFAAAPRPFQLLSALAEGVDRDAAQIALAQGGALRAITPFEHRAYERDFENADSVAAFRQYLDLADSRLQLDRDIEADGSYGPLRNHAYEAAGLEILAEADALVVVWDGHYGPTGGVFAIQHAAAARGVPTIWIDSHGEAETRARRADEEWRRIDLSDAPGVRSWLTASA